MKNDNTFPINHRNSAQLKYNVRDAVPYQLTMYGDDNSFQQQEQQAGATI